MIDDALPHTRGLITVHQSDTRLPRQNTLTVPGALQHRTTIRAARHQIFTAILTLLKRFAWRLLILVLKIWPGSRHWSFPAVQEELEIWMQSRDDVPYRLCGYPLSVLLLILTWNVFSVWNCGDVFMLLFDVLARLVSSYMYIWVLTQQTKHRHVFLCTHWVHLQHW